MYACANVANFRILMETYVACYSCKVFCAWLIGFLKIRLVKSKALPSWWWYINSVGIYLLIYTNISYYRWWSPCHVEWVFQRSSEGNLHGERGQVTGAICSCRLWLSRTLWCELCSSQNRGRNNQNSSLFSIFSFGYSSLHEYLTFSLEISRLIERKRERESCHIFLW